MNKIKSLLIVILATAFMSVDMTASPASAPEQEGQITTLSQKREVVNILTQQLPMELEVGMTWTNVEINSSGTLLTFTFSVDPEKVGGVTIDDFKKALDTFSKQEICNLLGSEFLDVLTMMNCDGRIIFNYPDGAHSTLNVPIL